MDHSFVLTRSRKHYAAKSRSGATSACLAFWPKTCLRLPDGLLCFVAEGRGAALTGQTGEWRATQRTRRTLRTFKKHRPRQGRAGEFDTRLHPCCALMLGFRCSVAGLAHSPSPYPPRFAPLQGRACKAQPHGWQLSQARTRRPQPIRCFMSPDVPATDGRDSIRTLLLSQPLFRQHRLLLHLLWVFLCFSIAPFPF